MFAEILNFVPGCQHIVLRVKIHPGHDDPTSSKCNKFVEAIQNSKKIRKVFPANKNLYLKCII